MKVLILGGDGMLGHQLLKTLQSRHEVKVTLRQDLSHYSQHGLFTKMNSFVGIDIRHYDSLLGVLADFHPEAVINAVGIIKQRKSAKEAIPSLEINSLFPHRLALMCQAIKARLVHISTDCVFNGNKGQYTESDSSDAEDLYGKSKYLGEVHDAHCVTLRSSIIGLELARKASLIEWFLAQKGRVQGFRSAIYSGLTTAEMSRVIELVLLKYPNLSGVWHVSTAPITKYDLLTTFAEILERTDVTIEPDDNLVCDRSLIGTEFIKATGYEPSTWQVMLKELADQVKHREKGIL